MNTVTKHIQRYPRARASTLAYLTLRDQKTEQLKAEIEARKRPVARLAAIVDKISALIGRTT